MVDVAVIGVGEMGKNHVRVLSEMDNVRLVSVADPNESVAERVVKKYKVAYYHDYRTMLEKEHLDIALVVVPTSSHRDVALDVIEAGVHVFIEKPIASDTMQAMEIIQRAKKRHIKLTIGHVERFNPAVIELKKRLDRGELGKVFQVHARRLGPFPPRIRDVGVVIDLATHDLDVIMHLIGTKVVRVYAETARRIHTEQEDLLSALLRFDDGTTGILHTNWLTPTKIRELSVTGAAGMFLVNYLTQDLYFYENNDGASKSDGFGGVLGVSEGCMTRYRLEKKEPLRAELESFVDAVVNDKQPLVTGEDGLRALAVAQAIVQSGLANQVQYVESI